MRTRSSRRLLLPLTSWLGVCVIAVGVALRLAYLDARPFWCDEAESAINALTILQKGYPSDTYLGLPLYENTLVQPWSDHPEYEFRDSSYANHMAVYHGWLPLYAIAASFALYDIWPDAPAPTLALRHDLDTRRQRTRAGRLPAVVFGVVLLPLVFLGGAKLYGRDTGWAALICVAVHSSPIAFSRQARYYAAAITVTTLCCVLLWLMAREGKWKHFIWGGLAYVLLFHTHLLSFFTACTVLLLLVPMIICQHSLGIRKLTVFGLIVACGSLPWIWYTGFYTHQAGIPRGWSLLSLRTDWLALLPTRWPYLGLLAVFALAVAWAACQPSLDAPRRRVPLLQTWRPLLFLTVWGACGYLSFLLFMPAASFFTGRLTLSYWGPMLLGASVMSAAIARLMAPRFASGIAPVILPGLGLLTGHPFGDLVTRYAPQGWAALEQLFDQLKLIQPEKRPKLYAAPNDHLILSFYTGLPFQSIMPVRKSFLDHYQGEVIFIDNIGFGINDQAAKHPTDVRVLRPEQLQQAALQSGEQLPVEAAERWSWLLNTREYRERILQSIAAAPAPSLEEVPAFANSLLVEQREQRRAHILASMQPGLMVRGFAVASWHDWL